MPPILSTSHCKFNGTCSCTHTQKAITLAPTHPFTKQIVPTLYPESFTRSLCRLFSPVFGVGIIKGFLPFFVHVIFPCFFVYSFYSHHTHFSWACGSLCEPRKYFFKLSFCAFTCLSNYSLIS